MNATGGSVGEEGAKAAPSAWTAPLLFTVALLFSFWNLGYRLPGGDEGAILTQAAKILRGALYYRDLDAYPLPGASYLLAGFMGVFGESVESARALAAIVFAALVVAIHAIALRVTDSRRALLAALGLLSFKFIAWPGLTAYTYWDLSFAFGCFAVALHLGVGTLAARTRLVLCGVCAALSLLCKQNLGLYVFAVASALVLFPSLARGSSDEERTWKTRRASWMWLASGFAIVVVPFVAAIAVSGALPRMVYSVVVRPLVSYLPTSGVAFAAPLRWWEFGTLQGMRGLPYFVEPYWQMVRRAELPGLSGGEDTLATSLYWGAGELFARLFYTAIVSVVVLCGWRWWRSRSAGTLASSANAQGRVFALHGFALGALLSAFPRADFPHLISVSPLLLVLGLHLCARAEARGAKWLPAVENTVTIALLGSSLALIALQQSRLTTALELERASLRIAPENAYVESIVRFVQGEVAPDEAFFVAVHEAHYYFLSDRYYDWPFVQLYPGMTGRAPAPEITQHLEARRPKLVVRGIELEGVPRLRDYAPSLEIWIEENYEADVEAFRRHPTPSGVPPESWVRVMRPR